MNKPFIEYGNLSDVGKVRNNNEDYFALYELSNEEVLALVCDGMGGHNAGEVASQKAVETIAAHFKSLSGNYLSANEIAKSIEIANEEIVTMSQDDPNLKGMGTTIVLLLIQNDIAHFANVGDSRIYLMRNSNIQQLSKDHSLVQQMIDGGIISKKEARDHPKRNVITKALGLSNSVESDVSKPFPIFVDDIFIMCSDGLTEYLNDDEIMTLVKNNDVSKAPKKLIDLANERGGKDNITVQIIKVLEGNRLKSTGGLGKSIFSYWTAIPLLLVLLAITGYLYRSDISQLVNPNTGKKDTLSKTIDLPLSKEHKNNKIHSKDSLVKDTNVTKVLKIDSIKKEDKK